MYSDSILFYPQIPYREKKLMNGDFCLYFVFEIEVANAWGNWFAGEFIPLNIQPTISHQNVLSGVRGCFWTSFSVFRFRFSAAVYSSSKFHSKFHII